MSETTRLVKVTQVVEVTTDDNKFDAEFMREFVESFYPYDTIEEHTEHLAQLHARGVYDLEGKSEFVEGYGPQAEMGIRVKTVSVDTEPA